jgi:hypothetical protein
MVRLHAGGETLWDCGWLWAGPRQRAVYRSEFLCSPDGNSNNAISLLITENSGIASVFYRGERLPSRPIGRTVGGRRGGVNGRGVAVQSREVADSVERGGGRERNLFWCMALATGGQVRLSMMIRVRLSGERSQYGECLWYFVRVWEDWILKSRWAAGLRDVPDRGRPPVGVYSSAIACGIVPRRSSVMGSGTL